MEDFLNIRVPSVTSELKDVSLSLPLSRPPGNTPGWCEPESTMGRGGSRVSGCVCSLLVDRKGQIDGLRASILSVEVQNLYSKSLDF